jgi:hypothetical protein
MAEPAPPPSREEQEFWDAQFRDPPRPRRDAAALPRRERRREPAFARLAERLGDRLTDWRHDARFGIVVLIGVALIAGVGVVWLDQRLSALQVLGLALVVAGVVALEVGGVTARS